MGLVFTPHLPDSLPDFADGRVAIDGADIGPPRLSAGVFEHSAVSRPGP